MSDHHHHHEGDEEEHMQCDHSKGHGLNDELMQDPVFEKQEWDLDDYAYMYSKQGPRKIKDRPTPALVTHAAALLPAEPCRVFVPLCGQTPDLRWLYDRGNTVVGLEGVELPVKNFFQVHSDLQYTVEERPFGKVYKTDDERLQVVVGDVTQLPPDALGLFDAGFDWGGYTAIKPSDRPKYVELVRAVMRPSSTYFLEVCHNAPPDAVGLPISVPLRTVKLDFGDKWKLRVLKTEDISEAWGVDSFFYSFILFTPKNLKTPPPPHVHGSRTSYAHN